MPSPLYSGGQDRLRYVASGGACLHLIASVLLSAPCSVIDMRERAMAIRPQQAISRDNVSLTLDGVVYVRVVEPEKCAYGARRPFYAVAQHAQSVMRAAIGRRNMEDAFHDRAGLNKDIRDDISAAAVAWGLEVMRYEVLNIEADASVSRAMDLQATAERRRREEIITADGLASAMERQAEAEKRSAILKAEGMADSVRLAAQAERERQVLTAMGQAESLKAVGAGLSQEAGVAAAHMQLAQAYMDMMGRMGSTSNTLMLSGGAGGAGSVEEMAARVSAVFSTMGVVPPVKTDPSVQTSDLPEAVSKSETTKPGKRAAPTPSDTVMATVEAALSSSPDADKREATDESFGAGLLDNKYFSNMR